ncbi:MAG: dienelactone hydrolase family protein [Devosia sp.]|nr:dienelactone hydrolase family protein [Devosia sp.]
MGERIKLTTGDGFSLNAYRAAPSGKAKGGVVLLQEVWGLNHWIRSEVDRYAAEGYLCVAPATMDRMEYGFESENYGSDHFAKVGELMKAFDPAKCLLDIEAAVQAAAPAGKVGITGYCFGGAWSWRAAHAGLGLTAASGYYGGGVPNYIDLAPTMPIEMHYGEQDTGIPLDQVEALRKRYPEVQIYLYPGVHGFCNSDKASYHAESAKLANARTLAFFAKHLA